MTQLRRLVAISILVVSLFGVAMAEGGDVQVPPVPAPVPPAGSITTDCAGTEVSVPPQPGLSGDIITIATTMLDTWLAAAMF
ncbi:MAG: hypothetical protein QOF72_913 [Blastocatellia bacterium]|jgi:hypothetical protein|nr:hypothetical protein [Blastocatellia bacterium]